MRRVRPEHTPLIRCADEWGTQNDEWTTRPRYTQLAMINVRCPRCGTLFFADEAHAGRLLRCSSCGDAVQIGFPQTAGYRNQPAIPIVVDSAKPATVSNPFGALRLRPKTLIWSTVVVLSLAGSGFLYSHFKKGDIFDQVARERVSPASPVVHSMVSISSGEYEPVRPSALLPEASVHSTGDEMAPKSSARGRGRLTLINGTGEDAVILVLDVDTGELARSIYVSAGTTGTIEGVPKGTYSVNVTTGTNWSDGEKSFLEDPSYFTFSHSYRFAETEFSDRIEYSKWSLTLNEVPDGNVNKEPITREQFWRVGQTVRHQ